MAIAIAVAALIVAIVRGGESAAPNTPTAQPSTTSTLASNDTTAADKALCHAIAPLMAESADIGKKFVNLGHTGTPERDSGIPQFQSEVGDWTKRIEPIVDADHGPPRFPIRTAEFAPVTRHDATGSSRRRVCCRPRVILDACGQTTDSTVGAFPPERSSPVSVSSRNLLSGLILQPWEVGVAHPRGPQTCDGHPRSRDHKPAHPGQPPPDA